MKTVQNRYKVYSYNNNRLVVVAEFESGDYKMAIDCCNAQQALLEIVQPNIAFSCFVTDMDNGNTIVAEAGKGDLDSWNVKNTGNFLNGCHLKK